MNVEEQMPAHGSFFPQEGEMGQLICAADWSKTSLGAIETWPQSLRTSISICLSSRFPILIFWGEELVKIYNDAYRAILGAKHPLSFAAKGEDVWPEIWHIIGPMLLGVLENGKATWSENQLQLVHRNGYAEECYFTFSYSPIYNEAGKVAGVFTAVTETTEAVINERHLRTLRDLGKHISGKKTTAEMYGNALEVLGSNRQDITYAALYAIGEDGNSATLTGTAGVTIPHPSVPAEIDFSPERIGSRNFQKCVHTSKAVIVTDLRQRLGDMPSGSWDIPPEEGILLPITHAGRQYPYAVLAIGINPHRRLTGQYSAFFQLLADQVGTGIANVLAYEETEKSEEKFRNMVMQAPMGIVMLKGPEFIVELANDAYLDIVGRSNEDLTGQAFLAAIPELRDQQAAIFLKDVYATGIPYSGTEFKTELVRNGKRETAYFNFTYRPMKDGDDHTTGVMVMAMEVSDLIRSRYAIQESEKQFRKMVMESPIAMTIFRGEDHLIEMANTEMFKNIWHKKPAETIGKKALEVFPELEQQKYPELLKHVMQTGMVHRETEAMAYVQGNDGLKKFYLDYEYAPLFEADSSISGVMITVNDVTEKVETRQATEESELRMKLAIQAAEMGTFDLDLVSAEFIFSVRLAEIFGLKGQQQLSRKDFVKAIHPDDIIRREKAHHTALNTGHLTYEARVVWADGSIHWIKVDGKLTYDTNNRPRRIYGTALDITERKIAEENLSQLAAIVQYSEDAIISKTLEGTITSWNPAAEHLLGYTAREMIGQSISTLIPEDRINEEPQIIEKIKKGERVDHFETKRLTKSGKLLDISITISPLKDNHGNITGASTIVRNITEKTRLYAELKESEEKFRLLADSMPQQIWTADPSGHLNYYNRSVYNYSGMSPEELREKGWLDIVHPEDREENMREWMQAVKTGEDFAFEHRFRRHNGDYRWQLSRALAQKDFNGEIQMWIGTSTDIHDQKIMAEELENKVRERTAELQKMNEEISNQKEFVEVIINSSLVLVTVFDTGTHIISFNKKCEEVFGMKKEQVLGKKFPEVFPGIETSPGYQHLLRTLAGETVYNSKYLSPVNGRYYERLLVPLKNSDNEIYAALMTEHDITGIVEATQQIEQSNEELLRTNHELEQFAYVASHDLQEPLRKIQTFASLLRANLHDTAISEKYFDKINSSAQRMSELIKAVLNYSRLSKTDEQFEEVDLNLVLENVKTDFELLIKEKNARIEHGVFPKVKGIPLQLNQLASNLLSNALKFSSQEPQISIHTRPLAPEKAATFPQLNPAVHYMELVFSDNGIGFEQQYAEKVFSIFQRLHGKQSYAGTGIGLALCKKIVENHSGHITVTSEPGKGTTFCIYLPGNDVLK